MRAELIAWTAFAAPADVPWTTDVGGGQALAEFAGRACYQSWAKPNPETATNAGYLEHILDVGHLSVLEHGSVSFYIRGISRSLTHELIRHRHFSYSQLSQRYVSEDDTDFVVPPAIAAVWDQAPIDPEHAAKYATVGQMFTASVEHARASYSELAREMVAREMVAPGGSMLTKTDIRKRSRQAARAVLPNATETRIVVTGNYRSWREFIAKRATEAADVEIRALAIAILGELQRHAPHVFSDFEVSTLGDGTQIAFSPLSVVPE